MSAVGQRILAALFLILTGRFVDDLFSADAGKKIAGLRRSGAEGAAALTRAVIEDLLGWQLDEAKRTLAAAAAPVLGVAVATQCEEGRPEAPPGVLPRTSRGANRARLGAQEQALVFSIAEERTKKWMGEIDDALRMGRLAPSRASKLAGKLSWGGSAVFGRGCRCYLAPLYRHAHQKGWRLDARAKAALQWWARFLPGAPRKVIPLGPAAPRPRIILYSDATGRGRRARARSREASERACAAG